MKLAGFSQAFAAKLESLIGATSNVKPVEHGEESQAFYVDSGTETFVVRLNPAVEGFAKDAFAYLRFSRRDLPIPEVISFGAMEDLFYCVSRCSPGVTLQDLPPDELKFLLVPTARILNAIATSDLTGIVGFGPFDDEGLGRYQSWLAFLVSIADQSLYDWPSLRSLVCTARIHPLTKRLKELSANIPEIRALVHGDFGSTNVLTENHRITGVVDWSEAMIGDPLYDVANIFFWRNWLSCMDRQACHFEGQLATNPTIADRLLCFQLRIGLAEIYQNAVKGKVDALEFALHHCEELTS